MFTRHADIKTGRIRQFVSPTRYSIAASVTLHCDTDGQVHQAANGVYRSCLLLAIVDHFYLTLLHMSDVLNVSHGPIQGSGDRQGCRSCRSEKGFQDACHALSSRCKHRDRSPSALRRGPKSGRPNTQSGRGRRPKLLSGFLICGTLGDQCAAYGLTSLLERCVELTHPCRPASLQLRQQQQLPQLQKMHLA